MKETPILKLLTYALFGMKLIWAILLVLILERVVVGQNLVIFNHNLKSIYKHIDFTISILIGLLLIYLYNHLTPSSVCIDGHVKLFLYFYGMLTVVGSIYEFYRDVHNEI